MSDVYLCSGINQEIVNIFPYFLSTVYSDITVNQVQTFNYDSKIEPQSYITDVKDIISMPWKLLFEPPDDIPANF